MALIFCDGFDHVDDGYELLKWDAYASASSVDYASTHGVGDTWGCRLGTSGLAYILKNLPASYSTLIVGCRFKFLSLSSTNQVFTFGDNGTSQVEMLVFSDGSIHFYRGGSTDIASSATGIISIETWYYIEFKIVFNNTTGSIVCKVDGVEKINQTSIDTVASANESANQVYIYANGNYVYPDDFYVCDTSGSLNNDFLGDVSIKTLYPTSDGTYSQFTPSTGSDHYALVDDPQLVADTDHNESSTVGHKDSYGVTTYSESGDILAVQICAAVRNTDTGSMAVRTLCRSGTTPADNEGNSFQLSQTMKGAMTIYEQEPTDTVAWTAAKVNAAEFGLKVQG